MLAVPERWLAEAFSACKRGNILGKGLCMSQCVVMSVVMSAVMSVANTRSVVTHIVFVLLVHPRIEYGSWSLHATDQPTYSEALELVAAGRTVVAGVCEDEGGTRQGALGGGCCRCHAYRQNEIWAQ